MTEPEASMVSASNEPSVVPLAPPTTPGPLRVVDPPGVWHRAVGISGLLIGASGLLYSGGQIIVHVVEFADDPGGWHRRLSATRGIWSAQGDAFRFVRDSLSLILALWLIVALTYLLRRKRVAGFMLVFWAAAKLLFEFAVGGYEMTMPDSQANTATLIVGLGAIALPVFILLWFRRPKIRTDIAKWP